MKTIELNSNYTDAHTDKGFACDELGRFHIDKALVMLYGSLFHIPVFPKLRIVGILLFWSDRTEPAASH